MPVKWTDKTPEGRELKGELLLKILKKRLGASFEKNYPETEQTLLKK